jgi:hypothetical protein
MTFNPIIKTPVSMVLEIDANATDHANIMLTSDVHLDSIKCDRKLFTQHLKRAERDNAPVLIAGDLFDAMQGRDDPRRNPEDLKEEYKTQSYFDALVLDVAKFLSGFEIPIYIIGQGNHETKVLQKMNTDLTKRLCHELNLNGRQAISFGYWGYVKFYFKYKRGGAAAGRRLYFYHGISGSAPVTHGIMDANRQGTWLHAPDICLNGHNHKSWIYSHPIEKMNEKTETPYKDIQWFLRTPGYKMSSTETLDINGFDAEKNRSPTAKGATYIKLEYCKEWPLVKMGFDIQIE